MVVVRSFLPVLPVLVAAQNQAPLVDQVKGWFGKAQSYIPSSNPIDVSASKVADVSVSPVTLSNWKDVLRPGSSAKGNNEPEEWIVYVTGANKTCYGMCAQADKAWNVSNNWDNAVL